VSPLHAKSQKGFPNYAKNQKGLTKPLRRMKMNIYCLLFGHHYIPVSSIENRAINATATETEYKTFNFFCMKCGKILKVDK